MRMKKSVIAVFVVALAFGVGAEAFAQNNVGAGPGFAGMADRLMFDRDGNLLGQAAFDAGLDRALAGGLITEWERDRIRELYARQGQEGNRPGVLDRLRQGGYSCPCNGSSWGRNPGGRRGRW